MRSPRARCTIRLRPTWVVDGTVLIFGHSSYLPVVYHQYYKTFDGIQNLKVGSIVSVYSGTLEYRYSVTGVKVADATQDVVQLPTTGEAPCIGDLRLLRDKEQPIRRDGGLCRDIRARLQVIGEVSEYVLAMRETTSSPAVGRKGPIARTRME